MVFISHRVNKVEELRELDLQYGVEIDLRDNIDGTIYIEHDPFKLGEDFESYLKEYRHGLMILNIKSERIEYKVLELIKKYSIEEYFFLDSSFPMIHQLAFEGERNIALRYSEFEGLDTLKAMQGKVKWVWVDCFTKIPLDREVFNQIKEMGYKLCFVSPELQGQGEKIESYVKYIKDQRIIFDAICTKQYNIEIWKRLICSE